MEMILRRVAMPIALLVPWYNFIINENGYVWETESEKLISEHATIKEALLNKPQGYKHYDNDWSKI